MVVEIWRVVDRSSVPPHPGAVESVWTPKGRADEGFRTSPGLAVGAWPAESVGDSVDVDLPRLHASPMGRWRYRPVEADGFLEGPRGGVYAGGRPNRQRGVHKPALELGHGNLELAFSHPTTSRTSSTSSPIAARLRRMRPGDQATPSGILGRPETSLQACTVAARRSRKARRLRASAEQLPSYILKAPQNDSAADRCWRANHIGEAGSGPRIRTATCCLAELSHWRRRYLRPFRRSASAARCTTFALARKVPTMKSCRLAITNCELEAPVFS